MMTITLQTFEDAWHGSSDRRFQAIYSLILWFFAGAYLSSAVIVDLFGIDTFFGAAAGGILLSMTANSVRRKIGS